MAKPQTRHVTLPRGTLALRYNTRPKLGSDDAYALDELLGFAQRINPKRAFLFVSKVLGRHIPVSPAIMRQAFTNLAHLIPNDLPEPVLVLGMAETAVGLSAGVHQVLQARYPNALLLNSTRHAQSDHDCALLTTFSEAHSHASSHLIYQSPDQTLQATLLATRTLIMVDDEASTGNTCVNVVTALRHAGLSALQQVHLTTLVDWSLDQPSDKATPLGLASVAGYRHHLLSGAWEWTDTPNPDPIHMPAVDTTQAGSQAIGDTGQWGRLPTLDSTKGAASYLNQFQRAYAEYVGADGFEGLQLPKKILVLGSNEFVWLPFLLAEWLEQQVSQISDAHQVRFSALTRSPIAIGGAIESVLSFTDHYGLGMTNFVYNVEPAAWDLIVLCIETSASSVDPLWQALANVLIVSPQSLET